MKTIKIQFSPEHLPVLEKALEIYTRLRLGQIGIALEMSMDEIHPRFKFEEIDILAKKALFPGLSSNSSYGIGSPKVGDGQIAYEVRKVLENFLSVKRNRGFWGSGVNFNEPLSYSGIPFPKVEGFKKYMDFKIPPKVAALASKHFKKGEYETAWNEIDKWKKSSKGIVSKISYEGGAKIIGKGKNIRLRIFRPRIN